MQSAIPASNREWNRRVWQLAGPVIISNSTVPLVGVVDTAVVGHLPDPMYIGAVAIGAIIFNFLFWGFSFLRMGTTGFVSQAFGAGAHIDITLNLHRALLIALVGGVFLLGAGAVIGDFAFWCFSTSADLESTARIYFDVRLWSAPAALANYALLGTLIGVQNTRGALYVQLLLNVSNVILDLTFVLGLGWGVAGVALASVISEYLALLAGLLIVRGYLLPRRGLWRLGDLLAPAALSRLLRVNRDIFIRTALLTFSWAYFTASGAKFGEVTLAANAVLLHFQSIMAYGLDGFAYAVEGLAGSAFGARNRLAFRKAVVITSSWAFVVAIVYCAVFWAFGPLLMSYVTGIEAVQSEGLRYMPWIIILPLLSMWSFQLDGIFIGTTHTGEMRNAMIVSVAGYLGCVWLITPGFGNHGLWFCLCLLMVLRALTLGYYYRRIEYRLAEQFSAAGGVAPARID